MRVWTKAVGCRLSKSRDGETWTWGIEEDDESREIASGLLQDEMKRVLGDCAVQQKGELHDRNITFSPSPHGHGNQTLTSELHDIRIPVSGPRDAIRTDIHTSLTPPTPYKQHTQPNLPLPTPTHPPNTTSEPPQLTRRKLTPMTTRLLAPRTSITNTTP